MEIDKNIDSFHFHGDLTQYPITAVMAVPHDDKSGTILRGRYLNREETRQIVKPADVIDGLLQNIFRIKNVMDAVISVVALASIIAIMSGVFCGALIWLVNLFSNDLVRMLFIN